uniref:DNA-directed RNA polymerase subunit n=1 Tax=Elaeophora elaphi TaxID=1147741 RepID=A0A0R3RKA3_9BILA
MLSEFCSECGTILPLPNTAPITITCTYCRTQWHIKPIRNKLVYRSEKIYQKRVMDAKEGALENPVIDKICDKCGHGKMSYTCRQTRSADEGQTVFYTCLKCNYNIVENA